MTKLSKVFFTLFAVFIGCVIGLLAGELVIRVFVPQSTYGGGMSYMDEVVLDLKSNFTGEFSHPDYVYTANTDDNRLRLTWTPDDAETDITVLVLGDSFAFGMGVNDDQTIASTISKQLHEWGIRAQVQNAGVPAYNLGEIRCKYERVKDVLRPDVVVVTTVFNDFVATEGGCEAILGGKKFDDQKKVSKKRMQTFWAKLYPTLRDLALGNSQLAVFLIKRSLNFLVKIGLRDAFRGILEAYDPDYHQKVKSSVDNVFPVLKDLKEKIQKEGRIGIFAYIPGTPEVDDDLWASSLKLGKKTLLRDFPHSHLTSAAREAGFKAIVDPVSDAKQLETLKTSYFKIDGHLNVKGNAFWGRLIAEKIRDSLKEPV